MTTTIIIGIITINAVQYDAAPHAVSWSASTVLCVNIGKVHIRCIPPLATIMAEANNNIKSPSIGYYAVKNTL